MNNVFLYAAKNSKAYQLVERYLTGLSFNGQLIILPPGSQFTSPLCLQLRSNDLIILFAEEEEDIVHLLDLRDEFECFRIILIMNSAHQLENSKFALLSPRLISYFDTNVDKVSTYLKNIFEK